MTVYFDNAATTPPLLHFDNDLLGNPSSPHGLGIATERKLDQARESIASILGFAPGQLTFTSGATEANNLALIGFAMANRRKNTIMMAEPWAHPSIIEPLKFIETQGLASIHIAPMDTWDLQQGDVRLAAISHVNHETGDIINMIPKLPNTTVLVDGVQGFCKEATNLENAHMYTFSAHKLHGAGGVGGLLCRGTRLMPQVYGGGQENNLRSGTQNTWGILQTANVINNLHSNMATNHGHVKSIRDYMAELTTILPDCYVNGNHTSPYILNMSFIGVKGEVLVHMLSERGVYVSTGAACKSRKNVKTILEAMGYDKARAESAVRLSFSHLNTMVEAEYARNVIAECVTTLRRIL